MSASTEAPITVRVTPSEKAAAQAMADEDKVSPEEAVRRVVMDEIVRRVQGRGRRHPGTILSFPKKVSDDPGRRD